MPSGLLCHRFPASADLEMLVKNPYWGNPDDTIRKVEEFWKTDYIDIAPQVEGAYDALVKLTQNGFRLVIVTARQVRELDRSLVWVEKNLPGLIDIFICTGQSQETLLDGKELVTKLSKADVRSSTSSSPHLPLLLSSISNGMNVHGVDWARACRCAARSAQSS